MSIFKSLASPFYEFKDEPLATPLVEGEYQEHTYSEDELANLPEDYETAIKEAMEASKSDKFKAFEAQLKALESVEALKLNPMARFQTAMVTSSITIEEIKDNIVSMQNTLNEEISKFTSATRAQLQLVIEGLNKKSGELSILIEENSTKIQELNVQNTEHANEIERLRTEADGENLKSTRGLADFNNFCDNLGFTLSQFSKEVDRNLGTKGV